MTHYLVKEDIYKHFKDYISKKEIALQTIRSCITINYEQIVIIEDPKFSVLSKK
jgi:hypothetical protein